MPSWHGREAPAAAVTTPGCIADCWNPAVIAELLRSSAGHIAVNDGESPFRAYVTGVDAWQPIPRVDPGLPSTLLPHDRIGDRSEHLLPQRQEKLADPAQQDVIETLGGVGAGDPAHGTMNV